MVNECFANYEFIHKIIHVILLHENHNADVELWVTFAPTQSTSTEKTQTHCGTERKENKYNHWAVWQTRALIMSNGLQNSYKIITIFRYMNKMFDLNIFEALKCFFMQIVQIKK